jgi:hypothetical protein
MEINEAGVKKTMAEYKNLDTKIQHGYLQILEGQTAAGCDEWLEAWADIKHLMAEAGIKDIYELDKKYAWSGLPSEFMLDMGKELRGAGGADPGYRQKYIAYKQELLSSRRIKTGRNGPCPCGSGRKYKQCCGRKTVV